MATANALATQSQPFSAVIALIKSRIVNGAIGAKSSNVQIICKPDDQMNEYLAETGYRIRVFPPDPMSNGGAGRLGVINSRRVIVYVVTESLKDPGGRDEKAVLAHLDREDSVVNAVHLSPPADTEYGFTVSLVGDLIKHASGGEEISRLLKVNPSIIVSGIPFDVQYVAPTLVKRDVPE